MPTIDQIVGSGIFAQNSDGSVSSAMFSMQEPFVAQEFAQLINSGRLSVHDAYRHFWSYEDKRLNEIFGVQGSMLLPAWNKALGSIMEMLKAEHRQELILSLTADYFKVERNPGKHRYNLFVREYEIGIELAKTYADDDTRSIIGNEALEKLLKEEDPFFKGIYVMYMGKVGFYDDRLGKYVMDSIHDQAFMKGCLRYFADLPYKGLMLKLLKTGNPEIEYKALVNLSYMGVYHPRMKSIYAEGLITKAQYSSLIAKCRKGFPKEILDLLKSDDKTDRTILTICFGIKKRIPPQVYSALKRGNAIEKTNAIDMLSVTKTYDPCLHDFLCSDDPELVFSALKAHKNMGRHDEMINELLTHPKLKIRMESVMALGDLGVYDARINDMLDSQDPNERKAALTALSKLKQYDPRCVGIIERDGTDKGAAIDALGKCDEYDKRIEALLDHPDENVRLSAVTVMTIRGIYDERIRSILETTQERIAQQIVWNMKGSDMTNELIGKLLSSPNQKIRSMALRKLNYIGIYHPKMEDIVKEGAESDRIEAAININENKRVDMAIFERIITEETYNMVRVYVDRITPNYDMLSSMIRNPRSSESHFLHIFGAMLQKMRNPGYMPGKYRQNPSIQAPKEQRLG